jgi:hypothetical protein
MEAAFSAIEVVGGFVGRDLVLVRAWTVVPMLCGFLQFGSTEI